MRHIILAVVLVVVTQAARAEQVPPPTPALTASLARALEIGPKTTARLFGPGSNRIVPEGDHYAVHLPSEVTLSVPTITGDDTILRVRPLGAARWRVDGATLPTALSIDGGKGSTPTAVSLDTTGLSYEALLDPTIGAPTWAALTLPAVHVRMQVSPAKVATAEAAKAGTFAIDTGGLDSFEVKTAAIDALFQDILTVGVADVLITAETGDAFRLRIGSIKTEIGTEELLAERERAAAAADTTADSFIDATTGAFTPDARVRLKQGISLLAHTLRSASAAVEVHDLTAGPATGAPAFRFDTAILSIRAALLDGSLDIHESVVMTRLAIPSLPYAYAGLLPRRLVLRPHLGGIDPHAVLRAIDRAIDNPDASEAEGRALGLSMVQHGNLVLGLDEVAVELPGTTIAGSGVLRLHGTDPELATATGDLRVTGIEALSEELGRHDETKVGVFAIIFLRGLGKPDGKAMVWHLDLSRGHLTVNGQDLTAMLGGAAPGTKTSPQP